MCIRDSFEADELAVLSALTVGDKEELSDDIEMCIRDRFIGFVSVSIQKRGSAAYCAGLPCWER